MLNSLKNSFWYSRNLTFLAIFVVLFVGLPSNLNIGFMLFLSFTFSQTVINSSLAIMNYNQSRKSYVLFVMSYPIIFAVIMTALIKLYSLIFPVSIRLFQLHLSLQLSGLTILALAIAITVTATLALSGLCPKAMILTIILAFSYGLFITLLVSIFGVKSEFIIVALFTAWYCTPLLIFIYYAKQPKNYDTMIKDVQQYENH